MDKHATTSLEKENRLLRTILDSIGDGIYAVSHDGEIIVYNQVMETIEKTDRKYVLGYKDTDIYMHFPSNEFMRTAVMKTKKSIRNKPLSYIMPTGHTVQMANSAYPFWEDGEISAIYCIIQDHTNINRLHERINTLNFLLNKERKNKKANGTYYNFSDIIGEGLKDVVHKAQHLALTPATIMIYGETGTGKELFAQSIHNTSQYCDGPFIAINCASVPETLLESQMFGTVAGAFSGAKDMPGFFEQAENGTLFLDEINSMSSRLQASLLRVLQDKTIRRLGDKTQKMINCRILSATNQNPFDEAFKENFRPDLLYRLMPTFLHLPPLRERTEDIVPLCLNFMENLNVTFNTNVNMIDPQFEKALKSYPWPGNVRELNNLMECCISNLRDDRTTILTIDHVPLFLKNHFEKVNEDVPRESGTLNYILTRYEERVLTTVFNENNGSITKTAKQFGLSRQNMYYRLKKFNLIHSDNNNA